MDLNCLLLKLRGDIHVTNQWYLFGLAIGVPRDIMDELKSYPREQCLVEVLDYWLRHHPSQPTWQQVVTAQEKVKFYQNVVNNIEDAHKGMLR